MTHDMISVSNLLLHMHHRLKAVGREPHVVVKGMHRLVWFRSIQPDGSDRLAHHCRVFLFDQPMVIVLIRATVTERETSDLLAPEAHQVVMETFGPMFRKDAMLSPRKVAAPECDASDLP